MLVHMAKRFTVSLPDHLYRRAQDELPTSVTFGQLLTEAVQEKLAELGECPHEVLRCKACGVSVERSTAPAG